MSPFRPHWFRYSLRTLFVAMTLFACVAGWLGWNAKQVRDRERMLSVLNERNATLQGMGKWRRPPLLWRLLGATELGQLNICWMPVKDFTDEELLQAKALFPEVGFCRPPSD
jgi:hypothetical protein